MNQTADLTTVVSLHEFQERMKKDDFYGETLIKWEKGSPVLIEIHQKLKPKDFTNFILVQVVR